jgi:hypothetical protein
MRAWVLSEREHVLAIFVPTQQTLQKMAQRNPLLNIRPIAPGGLIHVVVDTPRGSCPKYKYDEASGVWR